MPRSSPHHRRRIRGSVAIVAAAVTALGALTVTAAHASDTVSARLGDPAVYSGVIKAWPGDKDKDPAHATRQVDGESCWVMSNDPFNRYVYVDVDPAAIPAGATRALVTVRYHDAAPTGMRIAYDARSNAFQTTATQQLLGTGEFVSSQFELTDIRFSNNANGADFRVDVTANEGSVPPVCISDITVDFTDTPPLAITSRSLLFEEGDAAISLASAATSVDYVIGDAEGVPIKTGKAPVSGGKTSIDLNDFGPGYYTLKVTADPGAPVTRTTSFGIVTPTPAGAVSPDSFYGVGMHFGWQDVATEDALLETMALVGWGSTRSDAYWSSIEKSAGVYSFDNYVGTRGTRKAASLGITTTLNWMRDNPLYDGGKTPSTLEGLAAYAAYATASAQYYAQFGSSFSVYNEYNSTGFNNGGCGITADCYYKMLSTTYDAVKSVAPDTTVLGPTSAGFSLPFAQRLIELGGLDKLDVYSANNYGYHEPGQAPETGSYGTDLPVLADMIDQADGDRDIPFWITETGSATNTAGVTEEQQAERIVRAQVLAMAAGVDKLLIYDALDDGDDPTEREQRFGQFRRPAAGITGISPKPSAVSTAVLIRQLPDAKVGEREDAGHSDVYVYPSAADEETRILWSISPRTVAVSAETPITLTDEFGEATELTPHDGKVWIDLDGSPVYLHGAVGGVQVAEAPVSLEVAETSVTNGPLTATVTGTGAAASTVTIGEVATDLAGGDATADLTLPGVESTGTRRVTASVADDSGTYARLRDASTVIDSAVVTGRPAVALEADGVRTSLEIGITNNDPVNALPVKKVTWNAAGTNGVAEDAPDAVPAGSTATISIPVTGAELNMPYSYSVTALTGTGDVHDVGKLSWAPVADGDAASLPAISLDDQGKWVSLRGGTRDSSADLGGTVRFSSTPEAIRVDATVTDDIHVGARTNAVDSWQVDSLQFSAYTDFPGVVGAVRTEFTAALLDGGAVLYTHAAAPGQSTGDTPGGAVEISRDDAAGTTSYALSVPWAALGFSERPSSVFGLSLLVNDADSSAATDVRSGFIEWGGGVGTAPKDPLKFMSAQVISAGEPERPCDTTVDRDVKGPLVVAGGTTCLTGVTVSGPVMVTDGGSIRATDSTLMGMLLATSAGEVTLTSSELRGMLTVHGASGPVTIADSVLRGIAALSDNSGGVTLTGNETFGLLSCTGNDPSPTGGSNTIHGTTSGQCAGL
ncbi:hypothetical protein DY023_06125 [Microbacterium bovistercoris]|uniref:Carbohydrate-binding domain-containing protein n=1 Tax=Microbacterium bovistercoris TaxID=2293570 RepID=A0A371NV73_9MICO|nr:hypothetical protein [Microbacterium bovistercoris]REJ06469.1 hypothetical protein DY023_06125 [Microbacterium bovistercoris]